MHDRSCRMRVWTHSTNIFDAPLSSWVFSYDGRRPLANHIPRLRPHCAGVAGGESPAAVSHHDSLGFSQSETEH